MRSSWPYFAVGFLLAVGLARPLDRLALGDDVAESLGARPRHDPARSPARRPRCSPRRRRRWPGCSASSGWSIPHVVRLAGGTAGHRFVVPGLGARGGGAAADRRHARADGARADRAAGRAADGRARRAAVPQAAAERDVMPRCCEVRGVDGRRSARRRSCATPIARARRAGRARRGRRAQRRGQVDARARGGGDPAARRRQRALERRAASCAGASSRACAPSSPSAPRVPDGSCVREAVEIGRSPHIAPLRRADARRPRRRRPRAGRAPACTTLAERKLTTLSGGELQRVQIAVGLAQEAPALIADEPTAHLDLGATAAVARLLRGLADDGLAVLLVVHDLALAAAVADRVVVLSRGRAVATGRARRRARPRPPGRGLERRRRARERGRPHRPPRRLAELEPAGGPMTTAVHARRARRLPRQRHAHHQRARRRRACAPRA